MLCALSGLVWGRLLCDCRSCQHKPSSSLNFDRADAKSLWLDLAPEARSMLVLVEPAGNNAGMLEWKEQIGSERVLADEDGCMAEL